MNDLQRKKRPFLEVRYPDPLKPNFDSQVARNQEGSGRDKVPDESTPRPDRGVSTTQPTKADNPTLKERE
jgi:hypothetical protein